jgi:hypothetical protein
MYSVDSVSIEPGYRSDHSLIVLNIFKSEEILQGPSFWKFNTSLLKGKEYVTKTTKTIKDLKLKYNYVRDNGLKWDLIKMELRRDAISYSKYKAKLKRDNFKTLLKSQVELEDKIANNPTDDILAESNQVKQEIDDYNAEKTRGAMIRSKADWVEHGEKNNSFFLRLENRNNDIKNITTLLNDEDEIINKQDDILKEELKFYKSLYTQHPRPIERVREETKELFINNEIPKLTEDEKASCELVLTIDEIAKAVKNLKNEKTPGMDGFPVEFYKFFWKDVGPLVFDSLAGSINKGEMSIDQKRGVINLIPKKDKDVRRLKNWRPISLLNTDYKILTKTLATRLKHVLPSVIHPDQVAYLKGRYIGQNIRTIIDIMDYTNEQKLEGIVAFLDFEKAFDSIDWRVIDESLESFNIGPVFRKWVKIVYKDISSCVTNCGFSSEYFNITRGVRQGCPLSAYLFIVVAEILAINIRNDRNIKGIKIGDTETKVIQMADDTTNFIKDEKSLENILETLNKFYSYSGLKLNLTKCEAMWLGKNKDSKEKPLGLKWVKEAKALGITFTYDKKINYEKNFTKKLLELKRILAIWGQRDLSTLGRITIFKSLAFSKVIYQCNNLTVSEDFIKELNKLAFDFIWHKKPDKVNRTTIIADYDKGGLKMLDVESFVQAQKIMWVKRLLKIGEGSWKAYPKLVLSGLLDEYSFQCNTDLKEHEKTMNPFYLQLLKVWNKTKEQPGDDVIKLRREILWKNKNIKVNRKELLYKEWYKKGIVMLHDILQENGNFKTIEELELEHNVRIDCMYYNSLKNAIPTQWKRDVKKMRVPSLAISNKEKPFLNCNNRILALSIICNKDVYWELVTKKQTKPIAATKWCTEFNIPEQEWTIIYKTMTTIKETKMRAFQYKIINNLIPCNLYLKRIKRSNTDKCAKCNTLDDLKHYLIECPDTKIIWQHLEGWWKNICNQTITLTNFDIMLGLQPRNDNIKMKDQLNEIILATKWKIHANKQLGDNTNFHHIKMHIKNMLNSLKIIACRREQLQKYEKTWRQIDDHLL